MPFKQHNRTYDLVVFGATGYTGRLTAEHIATHLPTSLKWAVAGRSASKLQAVVDDIKRLNPDRLVPATEIASIDNDEELSALVKKTFVFITTVGPYSLYGEHGFKACAHAGTHYLDVTGEFPWTDKMIRKYEKTARASGAIMIPQIGIESAPPDLSTWALAKCLREQLGAKTKETFVTIHKLSSAPSGGTLSTVLGLFDVFSTREVAAACSPYASSPVPHKSPARPASSIRHRLFGLRNIPNLGLVTTSVAGATDIPIVERSWGLLSQIPSRKDEFYGSNFTWAEYYKARNWLHGIAVHWGLLIGGFLIACVPPVRTLARWFVFQPGSGPDTEDAKGEEIEYRGVASPDTDTPSNKQAFSRAWFYGSMYYLTGVFLGQAALTLLEDDVGLDGGVYTPACLGQPFIDRLGDAGFKMEVKLIDK